MMKKYIFIAAVITQSFIEIKSSPNTPSIMEKVGSTWTHIKNISKHYAPKIIKAMVYIGIPAGLTVGGLHYITCKQNNVHTTPFWQTCQAKNEAQLVAIKNSSQEFIKQYGPGIQENLHAAGTNVIKGLVYASQEIKDIIKDALKN
ncbi:hypothetical protein EKK58_01565 [Candidatus Dependentiae bacterium]|nr:MAG: hypothetical protein EKK58_01565 [Candidatus Dependentiae bacterium]